MTTRPPAAERVAWGPATGQRAARPPAGRPALGDPCQACSMSAAGTRVRELRKQHGMSQRDLARAAGLGERTVRRIEKGEGSDHSWGLVAKALGVNPADLIGLLPASEPVSVPRKRRSPGVWIVKRPDLSLEETMSEMVERQDPRYRGM